MPPAGVFGPSTLKGAVPAARLRECCCLLHAWALLATMCSPIKPLYLYPLPPVLKFLALCCCCSVLLPLPRLSPPAYLLCFTLD